VSDGPSPTGWAALDVIEIGLCSMTEHVALVGIALDGRSRAATREAAAWQGSEPGWTAAGVRGAGESRDGPAATPSNARYQQVRIDIIPLFWRAGLPPWARCHAVGRPQTAGPRLGTAATTISLVYKV